MNRIFLQKHTFRSIDRCLHPTGHIMTCHELFFVVGDLYVPGTQDAEVKKITVCGSRNIHMHPAEVVWGGWVGGGALKGKCEAQLEFVNCKL